MVGYELSWVSTHFFRYVFLQKSHTLMMGGKVILWICCHQDAEVSTHLGWMPPQVAHCLNTSNSEIHLCTTKLLCQARWNLSLLIWIIMSVLHKLHKGIHVNIHSSLFIRRITLHGKGFGLYSEFSPPPLACTMRLSLPTANITDRQASTDTLELS